MNLAKRTDLRLWHRSKARRHRKRLNGKFMSMKLRNHLGHSLLLAALAANVATLACSGNAAPNAHAGAPPGMPVKVQEARATPVSDATEYVATLKSRDSAVIMPQVEGQVTKIYVHSGEAVGADAPLMEIDPLKQQATVKSQESSRAAQEANLSYAKQQYVRSQGLYSAGVVSRQDLDQAKSAMDAAQAQMDSLDSQVHEQEVQLHYYRVTAPWTGIVGDVPVRVGDRVTSTTQLTTVDKPGSLEVYVYVPIEHSSQLKLNLPVQVLDGDGKVVADSRISFISPQVDTATQTVLVKARIANSNDSLRTAQFIRARMVWGSEEKPVVPVIAVSRLGGSGVAWISGCLSSLSLRFLFFAVGCVAGRRMWWRCAGV